MKKTTVCWCKYLPTLFVDISAAKSGRHTNVKIPESILFNQSNDVKLFALSRSRLNVAEDFKY